MATALHPSFLCPYLPSIRAPLGLRNPTPMESRGEGADGDPFPGNPTNGATEPMGPEPQNRYGVSNEPDERLFLLGCLADSSVLVGGAS